jgi:hypothetical protein
LPLQTRFSAWSPRPKPVNSASHPFTSSDVRLKLMLSVPKKFASVAAAAR